MRYDNIIDQPRPASRHPKMSAIDRAAQFSAFAALVGLDEQISETARITDRKIELSEDEIEVLNRKFLILAQKVIENTEHPKIKITYYIPDERKSGGSYATIIGAVKRVDNVFHNILLADGVKIDVSDILDFEIL